MATLQNVLSSLFRSPALSLSRSFNFVSVSFALPPAASRSEKNSLDERAVSTTRASFPILSSLFFFPFTALSPFSLSLSFSHRDSLTTKVVLLSRLTRVSYHSVNDGSQAESVF